ncbi:MAG: RluA family pseudouridine synthase [Candidatus Lambdaproteobacteria bacterium]|nr:RluA family pseudouridine synthase [Candidatus Lambdaproteobacteria bacterium]
MAAGRAVGAEAGVHRFTIAPEQAGQRFDKVLSGAEAIASREQARRLIIAGAATLNGQPAAPDARVRAGDTVAYRLPPPVETALVAEAAPLAALYEDAHLIVLDKPPGVAMHPGPGHGKGTLVHFLLAHCRDLSGIGGALRPGIVHRLDKDTSGVVVVAKTDAAHLGLAEQFRVHSIEREYLALVVGNPRRESGTIDRPIARDPRDRMKRAVHERGKRAVTHWRVERRLPPFTLLRLRLETGRTHQIRVHLAAEGWPVLGDPLYGHARHRGLHLPEPVKLAIERFGRQALHAAVLAFTHPTTGARLHFEAPPPPDLAELLKLLAQHAAEAGRAGSQS